LVNIYTFKQVKTQYDYLDLCTLLYAACFYFSPMLTWRDLQHIVVMTARPDYLDDPTWISNGVQRKGT